MEGLILGDCLDPEKGLPSLPDGSVDHVITDPPYSDAVHSRRNRTRHLNGYEVASIDFAAIDDARIILLARQFARVARRWVVVFTADQSLGAWIAALESAGLEHVRTGAWVKSDPMPQMSGDRPSMGFELIVLAHRPGRKAWNGGGRPFLYQGSRGDGEGKRAHPTQKPGYLMEGIVRDFTSRGDLVCDPFAGSGSTGVAARRLGRRFLGWELSKTFHAAATYRVESTREQLGFEGIF